MTVDDSSADGGQQQECAAVSAYQSIKPAAGKRRRDEDTEEDRGYGVIGNQDVGLPPSKKLRPGQLEPYRYHPPPAISALPTLPAADDVGTPNGELIAPSDDLECASQDHTQKSASEQNSSEIKSTHESATIAPTQGQIPFLDRTPETEDEVSLVQMALEAIKARTDERFHQRRFTPTKPLHVADLEGSYTVRFYELEQYYLEQWQKMREAGKATCAAPRLNRVVEWKAATDMPTWR